MCTGRRRRPLWPSSRPLFREDPDPQKTQQLPGTAGPRGSEVPPARARCPPAWRPPASCRVLPLRGGARPAHADASPRAPRAPCPLPRRPCRAEQSPPPGATGRGGRAGGTTERVPQALNPFLAPPVLSAAASGHGAAVQGPRHAQVALSMHACTACPAWPAAAQCWLRAWAPTCWREWQASGEGGGAVLSAA